MMYSSLEQALNASRDALETYLEDMSAIFEMGGGSFTFDFNEEGDYVVNLDFGALSDSIEGLEVNIDGSYYSSENVSELKTELENLYNYMNVFHYGIILTNLTAATPRHALEISSWTTFCQEVEKYETLNMGTIALTTEQQERFSSYLDYISELGEQTSGEKFTKVVEEMFV